jgi:polar amino acid transport system substrate-binding protein
MRRRRLTATKVLLGVAMLLSARSTPVRAQATSAIAPSAGTLATIARRGVLRVGMYPGLAPFVAAGGDADELRRLAHVDGAAQRAVDGRSVAGFDVDLAAAAARALDARLEIVLVERFEELLPGLVAGRYDVVMSGLTRTLARARVISFSDPYFTSGLQVLVPQDARFATLASLCAAHARVVVRAGTTAETFAHAALAGAGVRAIATDRELFTTLERGEADAAVTDLIGARDAAIRGQRHVRLRPLEDRRFTVEHLAFAVRQGDADWLAWLNLMLREAKASGEFHAIAARYSPWFRSEQ